MAAVPTVTSRYDVGVWGAAAPPPSPWLRRAFRRPGDEAFVRDGDLRPLRGGDRHGRSSTCTLGVLSLPAATLGLCGGLSMLRSVSREYYSRVVGWMALVWARHRKKRATHASGAAHAAGLSPHRSSHSPAARTVPRGAHAMAACRPVARALELRKRRGAPEPTSIAGASRRVAPPN